MRIHQANMMANKYFKKTDSYYEFNKKIDFTYMRVGRTWWEVKEIGVSIGDSAGGDGYWRAVRRVEVDEVKAFNPQKNWCHCGDECRDFVIIEGAKG